MGVKTKIKETKKKTKAPKVKDLNEVKKVSEQAGPKVVTEYYDPEKGPSQQALKTSFDMLDLLKAAYDKLINHERARQGDAFDLNKFVFEFARNVPAILKTNYPELEPLYLGNLNLTNEQKSMVFSYMNTCSCIPMAILLTEWYQTVHPEQFEEPDSEGVFTTVSTDGKKSNQVVN